MAVPCPPAGELASVDDLVERVEGEELGYVFIGERHGIGPAKRFAVDLVNSLVDRGHDVGLYVEGFRTDCPPRDPACRSIASIFNAEAFLTLLEESRAPVHPIDPPTEKRRAMAMATAIAGGSESIRVVLVGNSHVLYADHPEAEHWVYGGAVRYPDPGDVVKGFPRSRTLTLSLEVSEEVEGPYSLRADGCRADYTLVATATGAY